MARKSLMKINLNDSQDVFLICDYKPAQKLLITLLDLKELKVFTGYVSDIDMRSQAAVINMTFSAFESLTKKALIESESDDINFLYSLEKSCSDFLFKWKSVDQYETVINIGTVKVSESDYGLVINNVFLELSEEMSCLNKAILSSKKELADIKKEKEDALQLLSDATDIKERVEKELYSKFILILNEKKQKIRDLKENAYNKSANHTKYDGCKTKRTMAVHEISESSDETNDDIENMNVAGPSFSKKNNSFLFLDDDESEYLKVSPSKRRIRNKTTLNTTKNLSKSKSDLDNQKDTIIENESEDELLKFL